MVIKSVYDNQEEILSNIIKLHCPDGFELDPTYSKGVFYKKSIPQPKFKFDINPPTKKSGVKKANASNLPFKDETINSIMFDPPFIAAMPKKKATGIISKRFGYFRNVQNELWGMYHECLKEFYRIMKDKGVLVIKCQDTCYSGKQYFSHVEIINYAVGLGFYPKDLFILAKNNVIIDPKHKNQKHARKFHSYFIVFEKKKSAVTYTLS